jgi:hypothetical protein
MGVAKSGRSVSLPTILRQWGEQMWREQIAPPVLISEKLREVGINFNLVADGGHQFVKRLSIVEMPLLSPDCLLQVLDTDKGRGGMMLLVTLEHIAHQLIFARRQTNMLTDLPSHLEQHAAALLVLKIWGRPARLRPIRVAKQALPEEGSARFAQASLDIDLIPIGQGQLVLDNAETGPSTKKGRVAIVAIADNIPVRSVMLYHALPLTRYQSIRIWLQGNIVLRWRETPDCGTNSGQWSNDAPTVGRSDL